MSTTMKAILATAFGATDKVLSFDPAYPKPVRRKGKGELLIKVQASSLSPGDCRRLSGNVALMWRKGFPYIPCLDTCGVVVEADEDSKFKVGDSVISTWDFWALGGLAEYAVVKEKLSCRKPDKLNHLEAAALANSATHAMDAVDAAKIKSGDRVLVLGGSGGVGTTAMQMIKQLGPSLLVTTSTQEELMKELGADTVINYNKEKWWEVQDFKENPFDVILDLAEGSSAWHRVRHGQFLKPGSKGGRFVAVVAGNPRMPDGINGKSVTGLLGYFIPLLGRSLRNKLTPGGWAPKYVLYLGGVDAKKLERVVGEVEAGRLKAVLDPACPLPFTLEGAKRAFDMMESRHVHGKIVVEVSKD